MENTISQIEDGAIAALLCVEQDDDGDDLRVNYTTADIADASWTHLRHIITEFVETCRGKLDSSTFKRLFKSRIETNDMVGHDFWLTVNGHGSGFWDGDWDWYGDGEPGTVLTEVCKSIKPCAAYVGDDGKIYIFGKENNLLGGQL